MSKGARMYFNHPLAWEHLKKKRHVTTLRAGRVTAKDVHPTTVQIYRWGQHTGLTAQRIFLNRIRFDDEQYDTILEQWRFASGFATIEEWKAAAVKMSGNKNEWKLYMVEVIEEGTPILFGLDPKSAKRLWDNKDDEIWNGNH